MGKSFADEGVSRPWSFSGEGLGRPWPATGKLRWVRFFFTAVWLVYLGQPLDTIASKGHSAWWVAAAIALTSAFCAVFITVVLGWDRHPAWARHGLVLLFPLAAAFSLMFSGAAAAGPVVWIYVSSASGWVATSRRAALRATALVAVCYLFFSWLGHDDVSTVLITLIPVVFVGIAMSGIRLQIKLMAELRQAREEVAKLAANEERLRLARDMHDLTGQSLSMVTLKSELAARLLGRLPASPERDRARDEIEQVAAVSRQTLRDIREAISGYRRPTLAVEIITARTALASAGIAAHDDAGLTLLSGTFDPDAEAALAWCLREAVTNVVRHSAARECRIGLTRRSGTLSLEVRDDGNGFPVRPAQPAGPVPGSGLRGMSERLSAVGGRLELRPDAAPGFCLVATVPATGPAAVSATGPAAVSTTVPATVPATVRTQGPARVSVTE
jgi:two-component system, NarL family, sensor histidine kinase DesK